MLPDSLSSAAVFASGSPRRVAGCARLESIATGLWTSPRPTLVIFRLGLDVMGTGLLLLAMATAENVAIGRDSVSYWLVDTTDLYRWTEVSDSIGPFRYSPVLGQVLDPLGAIPWSTFAIAFLAVSLLALVILGGRLGLAFLLFPSVLAEVYLGNIDLFIAAALGFGLFWPPAWAFLLLSKGTPAVVLLWFVARREWRSLLLVLSTAALLALPSLLWTPSLWVDWFRASAGFATSTYGASEIPVAPRLVLAAVVVVIGARREWRWTIAVAGTLAMPGLDGKTATVALSILPLLGLGLRADLRIWRAMRRGPTASESGGLGYAGSSSNSGA